MRNSNLLHAAMTSLLAIGAASVAMSASAEEKQEQCAGVIKAGKNDCATSTNACHGHVSTDSHPEAWIYLPAGTCERIEGAHIVNVVDPTPKGKKS
jgi:Predicted integral membrane protein